MASSANSNRLDVGSSGRCEGTRDRTGKDERTKEGDLVGDEEMGERVLQLRSGVEDVSNPERVQDGAIRCLSL